MADSGDFSRLVTKIDRMQHLAAMPLDDAEASWEEYAAVRKIIIIYLQVVGLWDYVVDFAAATRGVPWAADNGTAQNPQVIYKIDVYDGLGPKTNAQRTANLDRPTVRLRVKMIIQAFLPYTIWWYNDILSLPEEKPVLWWFQTLDAFYLASTREAPTRFCCSHVQHSRSFISPARTTNEAVGLLVTSVLQPHRAQRYRAHRAVTSNLCNVPTAP